MQRPVSAAPVLYPYARMPCAVACGQRAILSNFPNYDSEAVYDFAHFINRLNSPESIEKKEYLQVKVLKFHLHVDNMSSSGIMHLLRGKYEVIRDLFNANDDQ